MNIFMTGASGWIGSATVQELRTAGHTVMGIARSDESARALETAGVTVVRSDLDNLDLLRESAAASDGVIHLAFKHDIAFTGGFEEAAQADRQAIQAFGDALRGSNRPLVIASGVLGISPGRLVTEADGHENPQTTTALTGPQTRQATAEYVLSLAGDGVRAVVVRLAPTNHGRGDNGFMASIVGMASNMGVAGYIGDGSQRWPAVNRLDSAHLFRLALEKAPAGTTLHGVAEEGIKIRDIAAVIGTQLNLPMRAITPNEVPKHFAWLAGFLTLDSPASNDVTRRIMNWEPTQPGLLADIEAGFYTQG